jgi:small subunit ribosomal protein S9
MADEQQQPPSDSETEGAAAAPPEEEQVVAQTPAAEEPAAEAPIAEAPVVAEPAAAEPAAEEPAAEEPAAEEPVAAASSPEGEPVAAQEPAASTPPAEGAEEEVEYEEEDEPAPREKPAVPGAHLEVDIVPEGVDPLAREQGYEDAYAVDPYATDEDQEDVQPETEESDVALTQPIATAAIDLASGARYRATGKRKSAIARVTLRPGSGTYLVNGRALEEHFPRITLQRNIRQPLETVGYEDRMDVVARLHGGGISAQAGALRHGVSRALLEADPNLRGELKRRGFLTRDSRAKERKKAGLKKARKRPQFSKR